MPVDLPLPNFVPNPTTYTVEPIDTFPGIAQSQSGYPRYLAAILEAYTPTWRPQIMGLLKIRSTILLRKYC